MASAASGPPVAVVAHGSGSCGDFVRRSLGPALDAAGLRLVALEDRSGDVEQVAAALGEQADRLGAAVVGGVSLGAHAAARVAAARPGLAGVLLLLPAWTGPPAEVAALSVTAAGEVAAGGLASAVDRVRGSGWAGQELARSWPSYGSAGLVAALRATGASRGPEPAELRLMAAPAGIVGLRDDPFHPLAVAEQWAHLVPRAQLAVLDQADPARDRGALGRAVVAAWTAARELTARSGSPSPAR